MKLSDFNLIGDTHVYRHDLEFSFDYSDGAEVETRILGILEACGDVSSFSPELIGKITDWPTEYHFSPVRHNLLRHMKFGPGMKVLEIGGGCGAITRQLGESGAEVHMVEGSLVRASCAAQRCRDLENVKVYCAKFGDVELDKKYDFVLLIGVLEYAIDFLGSMESCIKGANTALKNDGKLIIGIENQLGLKYFAGVSEDHASIAYFGIEDRYTNKFKTLGKSEITRLLQSSGFESVEFQYPFPDYKIPEVILMESAFQTEGFHVSDLIGSTRNRDYSDKTSPHFSCRFVYPVLERNSLIQDLSNSFLIIAGRIASGNGDEVARQAIAYKYTTNRRKSLCTRTAFFCDGAGEITVSKKKLFSNPQPSNAVMQYKDEDAKYVSGKTLDVAIDFALDCGDLQKAKSLVKLWLDYLRSSVRDDAEGTQWQNEPLNASLIDALPRNFQLVDDCLAQFDNEWKYEARFTAKFLWIKYLVEKLIIERTWKLNELIGVNSASLESISSQFGVTISESDFCEYQQIENQVRVDVFYGVSDKSLTLRQLNKLLNKQEFIMTLVQQRQPYRWQEASLVDLNTYVENSFSMLGKIKRKVLQRMKKQLFRFE